MASKSPAATSAPVSPRSLSLPALSMSLTDELPDAIAWAVDQS